LEQFLSHLRLQRFALFGHSMGGSIAIEAAGLLGERVTTLLVSNPICSPAAVSTAGALRRSQRQPLSPLCQAAGGGALAVGWLFAKQRPLGRLAGRQQPDTRQRRPGLPALPAALPENADRR
jgi:pimeloyl-ACP methyl ester carboxylesterase